MAQPSAIRLAPASSLSRLKGGVVPTAQNDVKAIGKRVVRLGTFHVQPGDKTVACLFIRDAVEEGIERLQRVAGKIHLRDQPGEDPRAKERKMNMRGAPRIVMIAPGVCAGLDGLEVVVASLVGDHASRAAEVGIEGSMVLIDLMPIASGGVCLPDLNQCATNRAAVFIQDAAMDKNTFSNRLSLVPISKVIVMQTDQAMAEDRPGLLGKSAWQHNKRVPRGPRDGRSVGRIVVVRLRAWARGRDRRNLGHTALLLNPFHGKRDALAYPDAHTGECSLAAKLLQLMGGGERQACATHTQRMTKGD